MSKKPVRPRLAEVQCTRYRFSPGDRLLVRTYRKLTPYEEKKLRRSISKWAGEEVEIFIYNALEMEITVDPAAERPILGSD